ncbi:MAG: hypothetical protein CM1200mP35_00060 [Chloroflexota bacterium]|nr:MAG: hypothetical protein CM1200mP35_00060 [Chloroflexota bacterium]
MLSTMRAKFGLSLSNRAVLFNWVKDAGFDECFGNGRRIRVFPQRLGW